MGAVMKNVGDPLMQIDELINTNACQSCSAASTLHITKYDDDDADNDNDDNGGGGGADEDGVLIYKG